MKTDHINPGSEDELIKKCHNIIKTALVEAVLFGLDVEVLYTALDIMKHHPDMEIDDVIMAAMVEWDVW